MAHTIGDDTKNMLQIFQSDLNLRSKATTFARFVEKCFEVGGLARRSIAQLFPYSAAGYCR